MSQNSIKDVFNLVSIQKSVDDEFCGGKYDNLSKNYGYELVIAKWPEPNSSQQEQKGQGKGSLMGSTHEFNSKDNFELHGNQKHAFIPINKNINKDSNYINSTSNYPDICNLEQSCSPFNQEGIIKSQDPNDIGNYFSTVDKMMDCTNEPTTPERPPRRSRRNSYLNGYDEKSKNKQVIYNNIYNFNEKKRFKKLIQKQDLDEIRRCLFGDE